MSDAVYYTAPSEAMFQEIKREAIYIWQTYDNTHGYADEKIDRIINLTNYKDNYMTIFAMFDNPNQQKLLTKLKPATVKRIYQAVKP